MQRLKRQITKQKQEYESLKKKYNKLYKQSLMSDVNHHKSLKTPKNKTWKSQNHTTSKTPRIMNDTKFNGKPKMKHNASVTVGSTYKKKKKERKRWKESK